MSAAVSDLDALPADLAFLAGGGQATHRILQRDWSEHPSGPPASWPDILKTMLSTVLNSPESMVLAWGGQELSFLFNEACFPLLGPRLSWAMVAPFREVWADAWEQAKPIIDNAFAGRSRRLTISLEAGYGSRRRRELVQLLLLARPGFPGQDPGLFIFTNETTKRVLADAALRQSEERLRLVIEGAKDHVILTTDPGGVVTSWSAGAEAILGWTPDEAVGRSASIIFAEEDRARGVDVRELELTLADLPVMRQRSRTTDRLLPPYACRYASHVRWSFS